MYCFIRVQGQLDPTWQHRFEGFQITHEDAGTTLLSGPLPDQAALQGTLLQAIRQGLTVLSLETSETRERAEKGMFDEKHHFRNNSTTGAATLQRRETAARPRAGADSGRADADPAAGGA